MASRMGDPTDTLAPAPGETLDGDATLSGATITGTPPSGLAASGPAASGAAALGQAMDEVRAVQARNGQARFEQEGRELARLERTRINQALSDGPRIPASRKMRSDASPAYRQGASIGIAAWLARVEPAAHGASPYTDAALRDDARPGPDGGSEPAPLPPAALPAPAAEPGGQNGARTAHPQTPGLMERIDRAGSPQLRALIALGPDIGQMVRQIARHRHDLNLQRDGERFIAAQERALAAATATTGTDEIERLRDAIDIASEVVTGTRDLTSHFPLYLDYVTWAWTCRETHELTGQLHVAQPDGSYRVGTFSIRDRATGELIWLHDGGGTVKALSAAGQPAKLDAESNEPRPLLNMAAVVAAVQQQYPHKIVVNGLKARTNKAPSDNG